MIVKKTTSYAGFGSRTKEIRKALNLRQKDVADAFGCQTMTVYRWEREDNAPPIDQLVRFAAEYGVSLNYWLAGEGPLLVSDLMDSYTEASLIETSKLILDATMDATILTRGDCIIAANDAAATLFGTTRQELDGSEASAYLGAVLNNDRLDELELKGSVGPIIAEIPTATGDAAEVEVTAVRIGGDDGFVCISLRTIGGLTPEEFDLIRTLRADKQLYDAVGQIVDGRRQQDAGLAALKKLSV